MEASRLEARSADEAHHPDPLLQRGGDAPRDARRPAPRGRRLRRRSSGSSSTTAPTDRTIEVARAHGVDHIVRLTNNKGLAYAFQAGLDACLKLGADVIVNTDGDNQYNGARHPASSSRRSLAGDADMVVGDREVMNIEHFSPLKKSLQRLGSWVVRQASETDVPDTTSGFRAYNREAAIQLIVVSKFTYTLETIIQAGKQFVAVDHVPIRTNPKTRESRLFPSMWSYVRRNALSIFRIYTRYEPLRVFMTAAALVAARRAHRLGAVPLLLHLRGRRRGPRPVAHPRRGAVQRGACCSPRSASSATC